MIFKPNYEYLLDSKNNLKVIINSDINKFNAKLLNIGDLKAPSKQIDVISVIFDLKGFTKFTNQVDLQLVIPKFISIFFSWLFNAIKTQIIANKRKNKLWAELPFFSKFMGDGALFLWKIDMTKLIKVIKPDFELIEFYLQPLLANIIVSMYNICLSYDDNYNEYLVKEFVEPPPKLRCGIARGKVFQIGKGRDYVGPCINISARLLQFDGLSFAFSAKGFDFDYFHKDYQDKFTKKIATIRGIGDKELIYVLKDEFDKLPVDVKNRFVDI